MFGVVQQKLELIINIKKLDSLKVSGHLIDYPEKSKGYIFYCSNHSLRIIEISNARFIENGKVRESVE